MDLDEIKQIIELMKENNLSVFELEKEGEKLKLERALAASGAAAPITAPDPLVQAAATQALLQGAPPAIVEGREITSPMVGTFYSSASPEAPPFVTVGQEVTPDSVVCIIEAMKVMNEIKAETSGVITEILADNGKPVQFGQALFRLK